MFCLVCCERRRGSVYAFCVWMRVLVCSAWRVDRVGGWLLLLLLFGWICVPVAFGVCCDALLVNGARLARLSSLELLGHLPVIMAGGCQPKGLSK